MVIYMNGQFLILKAVQGNNQKLINNIVNCNYNI